MSALDIAKKFVKDLEGLKLTAYLCQAGRETIGYGHTGPDVHDGKHITVAEAENLLDSDLSWFEKEVDDLVKVTLADHEKAALISFAFNVGAHALEISTLLRELNEGNRKNVEANFLMWDKCTVNGVKIVSSGLKRRRQAEANLFLEGRCNV